MLLQRQTTVASLPVIADSQGGERSRPHHEQLEALITRPWSAHNCASYFIVQVNFN